MGTWVWTEQPGGRSQLGGTSLGRLRRMAMRVTIEPQNLHWLSDGPAEHDLCAHGGAVLRIDDEVVIDDSTEEWALSAGAVFLLRTVGRDHTSEDPVAGHLLPHCGHAMFVDPASADVMIVGCPYGRDWRVVHVGHDVVLGFVDGREFKCPADVWRDAVLRFSQAVQQFYADSAPKKPSDADEAAGFEAFLNEWRRRSEQAGRAV